MEAVPVELEHSMRGPSGSPEGSNLQSAAPRESRRDQVGPSSTGKSRPPLPEARRMHMFMRASRPATQAARGHPVKTPRGGRRPSADVSRSTLPKERNGLYQH